MEHASRDITANNRKYPTTLSENVNTPTVSRRQHESRSPRRHSKPSNRTQAPNRRTPVENRSSIRRPWDKEFSPSENTPTRQIPATNK
ncbi:hypothetical protein ACF0H5_021997 [Mactra antiquata]